MHPNAVDITGMKFGKLLALNPTDERRDNKVMWDCQCDCGAKFKAAASDLRRKSVRSCGCLRSDSHVGDLVGQRFGRLVVQAYAGKSRWRCLCDCGNGSIAHTSNIKAGKSTSCGCYRNENSRTHGLSGLREYRIWSAMRDRCTNPRRKNFEHYGGRGIRVCERWDKSFAEFLADVGLAPSHRHSLDRIDNNRGYEPGNVRWATSREQLANRRSQKEVILSRMTVEELQIEIARKQGRLGVFG